MLRPLLLIALLPGSFVHAQKNLEGLSTGPTTHTSTTSPAFEVATIKPSNPEQWGWSMTIQSRHFVTANTSITDLISYAYGVHAKQIINGPPWLLQDRFDVDGLPEGEELPSRDLYRIMVQKLLTDRCQLNFHREKRELSAYVITIGKSGSKLKVSEFGPNDPAGFGFGPLGVLTIRNQTIGGFALVLQRTVLDKPVVDLTGLAGRFDFVLKWTPDESQFGQLKNSGLTVPLADPNGPPVLYTAIQEQLGLRLKAGKAFDDVIVIDRVQRPSAN